MSKDIWMSIGAVSGIVSKRGHLDKYFSLHSSSPRKIILSDGCGPAICATVVDN